MSNKSRLYVSLILAVSILAPNSVLAREFSLRLIYSHDAPAGRNSLNKLQSELNNFYGRHQTEACRAIKINIEYMKRDNSINPNKIDIRSRETFEALRNQAEDAGANVLVVRSLSYCGKTDSDYSGCAADGSILVVENNKNWGADTFIALLEHERGHSSKLAKAVRADGASHSDSPQDLMYPTVSGANNRLSQNECNFMNASHAKFQPTLHGASVNLVDADQEDLEFDQDETQTTNIVSADSNDPPNNNFSIVTSKWNGTPFDLLDAIDDREGLLTFSRALLLRTDAWPYWGNAAKVIGLYGTKNDVNLIFFVLAQPIDADSHDESISSITENVTKVKISAIEGLSFLAGRHGDRNALHRLEEIKAKLTLTELADEGRVPQSTAQTLNSELSGSIVLGNNSPYAIGDALNATISAVAQVGAVINPESTSADMAARVRIERTGDDVISLQTSDLDPIFDAALVPGSNNIPTADGYIDLPNSVDPNIVEEMQRTIEGVKAAENFDSYLRQ